MSTKDTFSVKPPSPLILALTPLTELLSLTCSGVGLMIHSRGARGSDFELVITQILQGLGGGFAAVASQVGAQASVPHVDVAIVTAVVLLWTEIGGAVGGAIGECQFFSLERKKKSIHNRILREIVIAGAIWSNEMPKALAKYLPDLTQDQRDALFGSITDVRSLPLSDPTRQGVISGTYSYSYPPLPPLYLSSILTPN